MPIIYVYIRRTQLVNHIHLLIPILKLNVRSSERFILWFEELSKHQYLSVYCEPSEKVERRDEVVAWNRMNVIHYTVTGKHFC